MGGDVARLELGWFGWSIVVLILLFGSLQLLNLIRMLLGFAGARLAAVLWLVLMIPLLATWFHAYQRCSHRNYSNRDVCISRGASTLRDTIIFGLPAIVALCCLLRAEWLERRAGRRLA